MKKFINLYLLTEHLHVLLYLEKSCEVLIWLESTSSYSFLYCLSLM